MTETRKRPWDQLGIELKANSVEEALNQADLNWDVVSQPAFVKEPVETRIPNLLINQRSDNNNFLGYTTEKYKIVQNRDAFSFIDGLVEKGFASFDKAGYFGNGEKIWTSLTLKETEVLGDKYNNNLIITNSHDGKGSIQIMITPIRIFCRNQLNLAMKNASRSWSARHLGNMDEKLKEAERTLELSEMYLSEFEVFANKLANIKINEKSLNKVIDNVFPFPVDASDRIVRNIEEKRNNFFSAYNEPDLNNLRGSAFGVVNAFSDMITHYQPARMTDTYQEKLFGKMLNGHNTLDKVVELVQAVA